jgi:hypothetical protein
MKRSTNSLTSIVITSIFLLACSLLSLPSITAETPPTLTPEFIVPSNEQPMESGTGLENENLLAAIPEGFKIDYQAEQDNMVINEMVPEAESVNDWTTMVTVQIFVGEMNISPEQYQETMNQNWFSACQGSESYPVADGAENGYTFVLWQLYCPLNPATQKVEYTYMKAIQGNDSFYLVQVAFRHEPSEADITQWMNYLRDVQVCDSRIPERGCP